MRDGFLLACSSITNPMTWKQAEKYPEQQESYTSLVDG